MYVHCGEETNIRDLRSYEHYWTGSWNKIWSDTGAALYQLSQEANWELVIML